LEELEMEIEEEVEIEYKGNNKNFKKAIAKLIFIGIETKIKTISNIFFFFFFYRGRKI
jgi:hypothetical protein